MVDLESLLDRSRTKRDTVNGQIYTQIPFLENGSSVMVCVREEPGAVFEQVTEVKKYYIELRPEEGEGLLQYVATMLISPKGYEGNPRFDFLNKGNVDGVMILSTLRGKVFEVVEYSEGMVRHARLVSPDADGDVAAGTRYAYVYNRGAVTKGESDEDGTRHDGEIVAAYCIAKRPKSEELEIDWKMYWINNYIEEEESGGDGDMGSAPGSEGGSGDYTYWQPEPDGPKYTIELSCNVPEHVEMVGSGGPYPRGQRVVIGYQMRSVPWYSEFKYWSGDFSGQSEACFLHILESDVKATAWFDVNPPCRDKARMVMNPLNDMRVAAMECP